MGRNQQILTGLAVHFGVWWLFSWWLWERFAWKMFVLVLPGAPVYLGFFYVQWRSTWEAGAAGIIVSLVLAGTVFAAFRKKRLWTTLLAHIAVLLYWLIGCALIAVGD
jgi:hypothetical protein